MVLRWLAADGGVIYYESFRLIINHEPYFVNEMQEEHMFVLSPLVALYLMY